MAKTEAPMIGKVIRQLQSEAVQGYQANDREMVVSIMNRYHGLKELIGNLRNTLDTLYDTTHLGYSDTEWLEGVERIVKIDPDKPRGRKAQVKVDPADLV